MTATAEAGASEAADAAGLLAALPVSLAEPPVAAVHAKAAPAHSAAANVMTRLLRKCMTPPLRRCGFSWERRRFYSRNVPPFKGGRAGRSCGCPGDRLTLRSRSL